MISLGQLQEIKDLREVWPHEALDFTPWLAEENNLALLADAVGLEITVDETESKVGDFNVDIYARIAAGWCWWQITMKLWQRSSGRS